jgi:hypothetical protein
VVTLRRITSGLLESLVVLDRYLFLKEKQREGGAFEVKVEPIFEQDVSPRNMAFIAFKH